MKVLTIINAVEGFYKLKNQLIKDKCILTELEIADSAFETTSDEAKKQAEIVEADKEAIRQYLTLNLTQIPSVLPEYKPIDTNNYSNKLNLEV